MPGYLEIIWSLNAILLSWILSQYFALRKEIQMINLSLVKNYATNEAIEKLIGNQNKMLDTLTQIKIDQATIFERIERFHAEKKRTVQTESEEPGTSSWR
jgi:uncharacterized protein YjgD (DUF1641 family)